MTQKKRVIYLANNKPSAIAGLRHIHAQGWDIPAVVAPGVERPHSGERLEDVARALKLRTLTMQELLAILPGQPAADPSLDQIDLVVSYLFWQKIVRPLIQLPKMGCINFHPAPLPDFRGVCGVNFAILEQLPQWGVSAHFVSESFDTGDLIEVRRFSFDASQETAFSLESLSLNHMNALFQEVIGRVASGQTLPRAPQGQGRYISRKDFEAARWVLPEDTPESIERKVRAFWYPPYPGVAIDPAHRASMKSQQELIHRLSEQLSSRHQAPSQTGVPCPE